MSTRHMWYLFFSLSLKSSIYLPTTTSECYSAVSLLFWTIQVIILYLHPRYETELNEIGPNFSPFLSEKCTCRIYLFFFFHKKYRKAFLQRKWNIFFSDKLPLHCIFHEKKIHAVWNQAPFEAIPLPFLLSLFSFRTSCGW